MMIAWGVHAIVKLLNYPILGEMHGADWVNKITYKILFLHASAFLFWMYFFNSPLSLAVVFTSVIGCQLIIFLFHLFYKIR
jgi:fatty acid desaturase